MKACRFAMLALAALALSGTCAAAAGFKNGTAFALGNVPKELVVERRAKEPVRFSLEENPSTGFTWEVESNTNECEVALERRGRDGKTTCGASGNLDVPSAREGDGREVLVRNQQLRPGSEGSLEVA